MSCTFKKQYACIVEFGKGPIGKGKGQGWAKLEKVQVICWPKHWHSGDHSKLSNSGSYLCIFDKQFIALHYAWERNHIGWAAEAPRINFG